MSRWFLLSMLLAPTLAVAEAPTLVHHQGHMADAAGTPLTGDHTLLVSLFDAPSGGTSIWSEELTAVPFDNGYYAVQLGTITPLTDEVLDVAGAWVELALDGGTPLPQRIRLTSVPYALNAAAAENAVNAASAETAQTAVNVDGGVVNATEIQINGTTVIGTDGTLAGAATYAAGSGLTLTDGTFAVDDASISPDWSNIQNIPPELADGDADTTYTAGTGLTLDGTTFNVTDNYVNVDGDGMDAEYPTLIIDHPTAGGASGIVFNSRVNRGSDRGFILFQDETANSPGTGNEDVRLTVGVHNDFRQSAAHSDELWLQGGGRLVQNVGDWDDEMDALMGSVPGVGTTGGYEWRVNDAAVMTLDHGGTLRPTAIELPCPTGYQAVAGGRLCVQVALNPTAGIHAAIADCSAQQARVCTHNDLQQACGVSGFNPYAGSTTGWYGDHGVAAGGNTDDEYLTWNRNTCDPNNDGPAYHSTSSYPYRCCM